jgi:hypothetical protein
LWDDIKKEFLPLLLLVFASIQLSKMGNFFFFVDLIHILCSFFAFPVVYLAFSTKQHTQHNDPTSSFWYDLCQKFVNGKFMVNNKQPFYP